MESETITNQLAAMEMEQSQEDIPSLMSMPEEVLHDCIFPFLNYNDLVHLRAVCKPIKLLSEQFLRSNFKHTVREVNETNYNFQHYLNVNLPTTSLFINNSSPSIFKDPSIPPFLQSHAPQITHLKLNHFDTCISELELHFLSSLPNLQHLEISVIPVPQQVYQFPPFIRTLKTLKLNEIQGHNKTACEIYAWQLILICDNLEYLKGCHISLRRITSYIKNRSEKFPNLPNLQFYDMVHYKAAKKEGDEGETWTGTTPLTYFRELMRLGFEHQVNLVNVSSELFAVCPTVVRTSPEEFTTPELSFPKFLAGLPNLNKLSIESTFKGQREEASILLSFIFDGQREACEDIRELAMREEYEDIRQLWDGRHGHGRLRHLDPGTRSSRLPRSCPFVTKLTLQNWEVGDEELARLLGGFPLLEEIVVEACEQLGDLDFEEGRRALLNLRKLKKFSLKRLDLMPNITDRAFQSVFKHLNVEEFYLTSERPLNKITFAGIESLLTGQLFMSLEKFPFVGWSLDGVSAEAFNELKYQFGAAYML